MGTVPLKGLEFFCSKKGTNPVNQCHLTLKIRLKILGISIEQYIEFDLVGEVPGNNISKSVGKN